MKPGSMAAAEAARNIEDVHDQRGVDLHQIQGVIDLARDDADETDLLLEVTAGPLAFLTMGPEPEQTIRVSPKQAREIAAKLIAWADERDFGESHQETPTERAMAMARSYFQRMSSRGVLTDPNVDALTYHLALLLKRVEERTVEPTADTERPLSHLADALSQEGSDPR